LLIAGPAGALTLELPPGAVRAAEQRSPLTSYAVPIAPWAQGGIAAVMAEGALTIEAWQANGAATTLQLLAPLRTQLADQDYEVLFECDTERCGGFDFRYEIEVLPEPEMHVDLGNFRFLSARRAAEEGPEFATLLVSRTSTTAYLQVTTIGGTQTAEAPPPLALSEPAPATATAPATALPLGAMADQLDTVGRAILGDLAFETGSSRLAAGEFPSLGELADYLRAHPDRRVTLVGHTDAQGGLQGNIALSRARARAAAEKLVTAYGIPAAQVEADGVGYLMPLASNLTAEGRAANRRVEVVLIATE
jgi:OOP family OmpA-OmpF porin